MSNISVTKKDGTAAIRVNGNFTFEVNRDFRSAYQSIPAKTPILIDLSQSSYMDSAGLGMLIRLREHAGGDITSVTIVGANDTVRNILDVANFSQLFTIR